MKKIKVHLIGEIISSNSTQAFSLYEKSAFGQPKQGKIQYTLSEALFLFEKKKLEPYDYRDKKIKKKTFLRRLRRIDKKIQLKYLVYKDLRERGYVVKTALKFGADFRVYPKGSRPGKKHAKWIVFVEHETKSLTWHSFSAKNRVAHSTKKKLLLAIIDEESDVTYYEVSWLKP